jgi:hypothetical protein
MQELNISLPPSSGEFLEVLIDDDLDLPTKLPADPRKIKFFR